MEHKRSLCQQVCTYIHWTGLTKTYFFFFYKIFLTFSFLDILASFGVTKPLNNEKLPYLQNILVTRPNNMIYIFVDVFLLVNVYHLIDWEKEAQPGKGGTIYQEGKRYGKTVRLMELNSRIAEIRKDSCRASSMFC